MVADVDLCNLALSYLGDEAIVASISPPDGSAQSSHCARFFPIARDTLLEMHSWGFATVRASLAQVTNPTSTWAYAYAVPNNIVNYLEVLDPAASDDYSVAMPFQNTLPGMTVAGIGVTVSQPFVVETDGYGNDILYTNQLGAVLRYTQSITDTTKFSPTFNICITRLLASMLAGPIIKGSEGRAEAANQLKIFNSAFEAAVESDANQRKLKVTSSAPWVANR